MQVAIDENQKETADLRFLLVSLIVFAGEEFSRRLSGR
jgi:hypothetical protein